MSGENIQVILNELKHIREDITELKEANKHKCDDCTKVALLNARLRDYESVVKDVKDMKIEKNILQKIIPWMITIGTTFIGWVIGGGWKFFVG